MKSSSHDPKTLANTSWNNHSLQPKLSPFAKELGRLGSERSPGFQGQLAKATGFISGNGSEPSKCTKSIFRREREPPTCWPVVTNNVVLIRYKMQKRKFPMCLWKASVLKYVKQEHCVSACVWFGDWLRSLLLAGRSVELGNYDLQLSQVSFPTFLPPFWLAWVCVRARVENSLENLWIKLQMGFSEVPHQVSDKHWVSFFFFFLKCRKKILSEALLFKCMCFYPGTLMSDGTLNQVKAVFYFVTTRKASFSSTRQQIETHGQILWRV